MLLKCRGLINVWSVLSFALAAHVAAMEAPKSLTKTNFKKVRDYVVGGEQRFLDVDWKATVLDGHNASLKEDKPILLWLYFGGPMGNC